MLGVPEPLQRELVLLSVMLEQPSFVPLDTHWEARKPVLTCRGMEDKRRRQWTDSYCRKSRIVNTRKRIRRQ